LPPIKNNTQSKTTLKQLMGTVTMMQREIWRLRSERGSISHILHEDLMQLIIAAKNYTECISIDNKKETAEKTAAILDTTIEKLRNLHRQLDIPQFKLVGLTGAIRALLLKVDFERICKTKIEKLDEGINEINEYTQLAVYQILEELLKNISTHSHADNAHIYLEIHDKQLFLTVCDNGIGFYNIEKYWREGLHKIKLIIYELNGRMILDSSPGAGCLFRAVIPLEYASENLINPTNHTQKNIK
jgi:signal transduction histidine kinase